jgi:chemotaxis family two-component system response regulator Rcp1
MEAHSTQRLVLIVEDNPEHARLIQTAFEQNAGGPQMVAIADGNQALDFLHRRGSYSNAPRPDLILLDLNLPGRNGQEVLSEIKADSQLKRIPIIVLTASASETDIFRTYALQGNCYVIKSSDLEQLFQIVRRIEEFWLGIVTLPVE